MNFFEKYLSREIDVLLKKDREDIFQRVQEVKHDAHPE